MQPPIITDYKIYLLEANPLLTPKACSDYIILLEKRLTQLTTTIFTDKIKFDKKDPFSFAKCSDKFLVILSGKAFPTHFSGSQICKFNFAFVAGTPLPLMVHTRSKITSNHPDCLDPEWIKTLITLNRKIPEIVKLRASYHYVDNQRVLKRGVVYDYCKLGDLNGFINGYLEKREKVPQDIAKHLIFSMVRVFQEIHANNIAHRDVKIENIFLKLIQGHLAIKVGDWEFSQDLTKGPILHLGGTPSNYAPEMYDNNFGLHNDVWALGVACFKLYNSQNPCFSDVLIPIKGTCKAIGWKSFNTQVATFRTNPPPVDDLYAILIWKMLDPNPDTRIKLADINLSTLD